ncbi:MAG: DUF6588 family protein [Candidatus Krumholzibacteriia bacterium]
MFHSRSFPVGLALAAGLTLAAAGLPAPAVAQSDSGDQSLQNLLQDVGFEYAQGYLAPLIQTLGANQNSGLYTTARIPRGKLTFSVGLKAMGSRLAASDSAFSRTLDVTLDETYGVNPGDPGYGEQGVVEMSGPTVFGNDSRSGSIRAYYLGALVAEQPGIEGLIDTRWSPLVMPEVSLGGIAGFRATVRWLPDIDAGDAGKIKLWGYGLQYGLSSAMPSPPVDVMVGFFKQNLDIGDVIETDATSWFLAASKSFSVLTFYGGAARESSNFQAHYTWNRTDGTEVPVSFAVDGKQKSRYTLGASLGIGVRLSADVNWGSEITTYTAGLGFGL